MEKDAMERAKALISEKTNIDAVEYTEKNGKKFYKITAEGKTYRAFDKTDAFKQLKDGLFKVGDNVSLQYKDNKSGEYTYHNLDTIEKLSGQTAPATPTQTPKAPEKYSLSTDTRQIIIVRQNALRHADELAKIYGKGEAEMPEEMYFKTAEKIEKWIWRDLVK